FGFETVSVFTDPAKAFAVLSMRLRDRRAATAGRESSAGAHLAAARSRTLELVEPLTDEQVTRQHRPIMSPIVWDLGHIANYEEIWSIRALDPAAPVTEDVDWIYDPVANPRPTRKHLPLPDRAGALAPRHAARARVRPQLAQGNSPPSAPL